MLRNIRVGNKCNEFDLFHIWDCDLLNNCIFRVHAPIKILFRRTFLMIHKLWVIIDDS